MVKTANFYGCYKIKKLREALDTDEPHHEIWEKVDVPTSQLYEIQMVVFEDTSCLQASSTSSWYRSSIRIL